MPPSRYHFYTAAPRLIDKARLPPFPGPACWRRRRSEQQHQDIGGEALLRHRDQVLPSVNQTIFDVAGKITAELQEFGQLLCDVMVGPRMSEKDGFQALSIARKTPFRRENRGRPGRIHPPSTNRSW